MLLSVYLHDEIHSVLNCFGELNDVVDKILVAAAEGQIELMCKPPAPDRSGARRFDIEVTNEDYLTLLRQVGTKSPRVSLRRLLYWFVEEEVYEMLGWEMTNDYRSDKDAKFKKRIDDISKQVEDVRDRYSSLYHDKLTSILRILEELKNA